jgi:hypothetical protein
MSISCAISADRILADRRLWPSCVADGGGSTMLIPPIRSTVHFRKICGVMFVKDGSMLPGQSLELSVEIQVR